EAVERRDPNTLQVTASVGRNVGIFGGSLATDIPAATFMRCSRGYITLLSELATYLTIIDEASLTLIGNFNNPLPGPGAFFTHNQGMPEIDGAGNLWIFGIDVLSTFAGSGNAPVLVKCNGVDPTSIAASYDLSSAFTIDTTGTTCGIIYCPDL